MNRNESFDSMFSQDDSHLNPSNEGELFDFDRVSTAENFDELNSPEEDDAILAQFAKNPFGGMESRESFFQVNEFDEDIKSVGADALTSFINRRAFQNTEKLEFSDPTVVNDMNYDMSVVQNFMAVTPEMFMFNFDVRGYAKELKKTQNPLEEKGEIVDNSTPAEYGQGQKKKETQLR